MLENSGYWLFGLILGFTLISSLFLSVKVTGVSMEPNYHDKTIGIVLKHTKKIKRSEVVVLQKKEAQEYLIKRIIGLPGETIYCENNTIYINNKKLKEPYLPTPQSTSNFPPITLSKDEYFVLGDNRSFSFDSREFGPIKKEQIIGRWFFENKIASYFSQNTQR